MDEHFVFPSKWVYGLFHDKTQALRVFQQQKYIIHSHGGWVKSWLSTLLGAVGILHYSCNADRKVLPIIISALLPLKAWQGNTPKSFKVQLSKSFQKAFRMHFSSGLGFKWKKVLARGKLWFDAFLWAFCAPMDVTAKTKQSGFKVRGNDKG